jgi:hypothetical protein
MSHEMNSLSRCVHHGRQVLQLSIEGVARGDAGAAVTTPVVAPHRVPLRQKRFDELPRLLAENAAVHEHEAQA